MLLLSALSTTSVGSGSPATHRRSAGPFRGGCSALLLRACHAPVAQVESIVSLLWHEPQRLGRSYAELRAFRPFLFLSVPDLASSVALAAVVPGAVASGSDSQRQSKILTLLRSLRAANILHALVARLPRECSMPHSHAQMTLIQYSALLDSAALEAQVI